MRSTSCLNLTAFACLTNLITTSSPLRRVARCTWPTDAAARGFDSIDLKLSKKLGIALPLSVSSQFSGGIDAACWYSCCSCLHFSSPRRSGLKAKICASFTAIRPWACIQSKSAGFLRMICLMNLKKVTIRMVGNG